MRFLKGISILLLLLGSSSKGWSQQRADVRLGYERLVAVVPMVGTGTYDDPRRPAYIPDYLLPQRLLNDQRDARPSPLTSEAPKAITKFTYELSDDGEFALIELQAMHRSAFEPLIQAAGKRGASTELGANRNALDGYDLKVFEVGKAKRTEIEQEFKKYKQGFLLESFGGRRP